MSAPVVRMIGPEARVRSHASAASRSPSVTRSHLFSTMRSAEASWRSTVSRSRSSSCRDRTVSTSARTTTRSRASPGCRVATSAMADGSATPLASTRIWSGGRSPSSRRSSAPTRSSPHGAADAPVRERDCVPAVGGDEVAVDVQLAEVVDEDRVAHPVAAGEHAVEECRLARSEEPPDDVHRHPAAHGSSPGGSSPIDATSCPRSRSMRTLASGTFSFASSFNPLLDG